MMFMSVEIARKVTMMMIMEMTRWCTSANRTTASLLCDLVGFDTVQLGAVKLGHHSVALN